MRADRLLSILLLLQSKGRMSAKQLADELEVTVRTIYRDIDALSTSGIPVYGEPGVNGGYSLLESYRSRLHGLTEKDVRALSLLDIPEPLMKLGAGQELKTALLRLSAAFDPSLAGFGTDQAQRVHIDSVWWQQGDASVPFLDIIHRAVLGDRQLRIRNMLPFPGDIELVIHPLGLVAKAGVWHLVYRIHGNIRVIGVQSLLEVILLDETFDRPAAFDLVTYWNTWCRKRENDLVSYPVRIRFLPSFRPVLQRWFGESVKQRIDEAVPDDQGRLSIELSFESIESARDRLLSFGRGVEVLEPRALRHSIRDYAEQTAALYRE